MMTRRDLGLAFAADLLKPLRVELGPEQAIARGVPWPYLLQLRDGTTVVFAHVSWPKGGKYPSHYTAISRDGRRTWQEWKPGPSHGTGPITEGSAVELRDGTLLVFNVHAEHMGGKMFETNSWSSRDSYRTLEGPKKFRFAMAEAEIAGKDDRGEPISRLYFRRSVLELAGGDLLASAYGRFESDKVPVEYLGAMTKMRSFLLRSRDRGATWTYVSTIAADPVEQEGPAEPAIVQLTQGALKGRLICVVRTGRENPIYQCESGDEGRGVDIDAQYRSSSRMRRTKSPADSSCICMPAVRASRAAISIGWRGEVTPVISATGLPRFVMRICSPAAARTTSSLRRALASARGISVIGRS